MVIEQFKLQAHIFNGGFFLTTNCSWLRLSQSIPVFKSEYLNQEEYQGR